MKYDDATIVIIVVDGPTYTHLTPHDRKHIMWTDILYEKNLLCGKFFYYWLCACRCTIIVFLYLLKS